MFTNERVRQYKAHFSAAPQAVPAGNVDVSGNGRWKIWQDAGTRIDAPILGNGSMTAAFAWPSRNPQFWVSSNDFWQMESAANWEFFHDNAQAKHDPAMSLGSPRPIGRLVFDIPKLEEASCLVDQDFFTAVTRAVWKKNDRPILEMESFVAASENILILTLKPEIELELFYDFLFPNETGMGCETGVDCFGEGNDDQVRNGMFTGMVGGRPLQVKEIRHGLISGYREFSERVDIPVKAGFAAVFVEEDVKKQELFPYCSNRKLLKAGRTCHFILPVRTWRKVSRPFEYARSRAGYFHLSDLEALRAQHLAHWKRFWDISEIRLDDPVVEQRYYLSHYVFASLSKDPDYPPNILGISTFDRMAWNGNYKINYNHQTPYLGQLTAGHFEQADPHDAPYLDLLDITREMSERLLGHGGAYYPLGLGPHGMVSEALLLYMKSPAVHGALNMIMRYSLTEDIGYLEKVYPFLRSVADFWEKDLVKRDDGHHVVGDGMHERITKHVEEDGLPEDPVNTLGYLKTFFSFMPKAAAALETDQEKVQTWKEIADGLAPYPTGTIRRIRENPTLWAEAEVSLQELLTEEELDLPVFYDEGKGGKWSLHFPGNVMQIYPGNAIGLSSDQKLLEIARNTVRVHAHMENALAKVLCSREYPDGKLPEGSKTQLSEKSKTQQPEESKTQLPQSSGTRQPELSDELISEKKFHFYKSGAWNAMNLSCLFFPAAVRIGYDPEEIWKEMTDMIRFRGLPNGYLEGNPHGIEELSTIPNTLQEMLLQSHEGIIRVFPVWPVRRHPEASFTGFWAYGAFQVSAALEKGQVKEIEILSHHGNELVLDNPWKGHSVRVQRGEKEILIPDSPSELRMETGKEETIRLSLTAAEVMKAAEE